MAGIDLTPAVEKQNLANLAERNESYQELITVINQIKAFIGHDNLMAIDQPTISLRNIEAYLIAIPFYLLQVENQKDYKTLEPFKNSASDKQMQAFFKGLKKQKTADDRRDYAIEFLYDVIAVEITTLYANLINLSSNLRSTADASVQASYSNIQTPKSTRNIPDVISKLISINESISNNNRQYLQQEVLRQINSEYRILLTITNQAKVDLLAYLLTFIETCGLKDEAKKIHEAYSKNPNLNLADFWNDILESLRKSSILESDLFVLSRLIARFERIQSVIDETDEHFKGLHLLTATTEEQKQLLREQTLTVTRTLFEIKAIMSSPKEDLEQTNTSSNKQKFKSAIPITHKIDKKRATIGEQTFNVANKAVEIFKHSEKNPKNMLAYKASSLQAKAIALTKKISDSKNSFFKSQADVKNDSYCNNIFESARSLENKLSATKNTDELKQGTQSASEFYEKLTTMKEEIQHRGFFGYWLNIQARSFCNDIDQLLLSIRDIASTLSDKRLFNLINQEQQRYEERLSKIVGSGNDEQPSPEEYQVAVPHQII